MPLTKNLTKKQNSLVRRNIFLFFLRDFIYLRESKHEGGGQREREKESSLPTEQEGPYTARSQDPRIITWAKGRCFTDWAIQVPRKEHFSKCVHNFLSSYTKIMEHIELSRWMPLQTVITVRLCNIMTTSGLTEMYKTTCFSTKWLQVAFFLPPFFPPFPYVCWRLLSYSEEAQHTTAFAPWRLNKTQLFPQQPVSAPSSPSTAEHLDLNKRLYICPRWHYPSGKHSCPPVWNLRTFFLSWAFPSLSMCLVSQEWVLLAHQEAFAGLWHVICLDSRTPTPEPSTISVFMSCFLTCLPTIFSLKNILLDSKNPQKYR